MTGVTGWAQKPVDTAAGTWAWDGGTGSQSYCSRTGACGPEQEGGTDTETRASPPTAPSPPLQLLKDRAVGVTVRHLTPTLSVEGKGRASESG